MVSIPLVLTTFFLSDSWVVFFFGPTFAKSAPSLKILVCALPLIFLNYVLINTLIALNMEKMITWGSGLAILFNVGANIVVLPRYGYLGASWTTVATELLLSICFLGFLQRYFFHLPLMRTILETGIERGIDGTSPLGVGVPAVGGGLDSGFYGLWIRSHRLSSDYPGRLVVYKKNPDSTPGRARCQTRG